MREQQVASKQEPAEVELVERLSAELERVTARMEPHFSRREAHEAASRYVKALLAPVERKNSWGLSEEAGEADPYSLQHMVRRAKWDEEAVRDDVLDYARQHLGEEAVLVVDETGFLKKGEKSAGVARQYTGTAGRIENAQVGVFLAYVTERGHTLIDRELYLPEHWLEDRERCREAGIGEQVLFQTKPQLAQRMLSRALEAGLKPEWIGGDEVYGRDGKFRRFLEQHALRYVLAVASNTYVDRGLSQVMAAQVLEELEPSDWTRLSAGKGSKGPRVYEWARVKINSYLAPMQRWLMFRRSLTDEKEMAYYAVHAPEHTSLEAMVRAAGQRWPVEECFESAKGEVGLGDYEVRTYTGWYRHMTLCLVAHAFLAAARVTAHELEAAFGPKALALPHCRASMERFRRRQGPASSASRSKSFDA